MIQPVDWDAFVGAMDFEELYQPLPVLARWTGFLTLPNGLEFQCETHKWGSGRPVTARVEAIFPDVIRFRMRQGAIISRPSAMLVDDPWQAPKITVDHSASGLSMQTERLRLDIQRDPWQMSAAERGSSDLPFFRQQVDDRCYGPAYESPPVGFLEDRHGRMSVHESLSVQPGEALYGFGEKFTPLNKWGQQFASWAIDSGNVSSRRSYKNIPFWMSSAGYGIFAHTSSPMLYQLGSESAVSYTFHVLAEELDYYLIYGPTFKHILKRYCDLTGRAPVPPKWSLGLWISSCGYKSRAEAEAVVAGFRSRGLPLDVISLDPWWMGEGPWTTLEWDERAFPDPAGMMQSLRADGVRTCLWIHPYAPKGSAICDEALARGYMVRKGDGSPSRVIEPFTAGELYAVDFTNADAATWWQGKLEALLDMGAAVFKTDFGEQAPVDAVYHDGRSGVEMHNLYPLLYNKTVFELTQRKFGRGLTWGRSGYAGSQRYPVQWGGDSYASLDQMASQLRGLLGYGMSGVLFCSHDVGGFDYPPEAFNTGDVTAYPRLAEVYLRWLQFGVFSSHLRAHGKQPREPWEYGPDAERIASRYLKLRYRLLPYLYTEMARSSREGLPMVRPLVLEYQHDRNARDLDLQYLFGSSLLVAPVTSQRREVPVYLPAGRWVDFWTKELIDGGRWLEVEAPLEKIPVFVKGGSILPLGPEMAWVDQRPLDPLTLEIYAPAAEGALTITDEDQPEITARYTREPGRLQVSCSPAAGNLEVIVYCLPIRSATCGGRGLPVVPVDGGQRVTEDARSRTVLDLETE